MTQQTLTDEPPTWTRVASTYFTQQNGGFSPHTLGLLRFDALDPRAVHPAKSNMTAVDKVVEKVGDKKAASNMVKVGTSTKNGWFSQPIVINDWPEKGDRNWLPVRRVHGGKAPVVLISSDKPKLHTSERTRAPTPHNGATALNPFENPGKLFSVPTGTRAVHFPPPRHPCQCGQHQSHAMGAGCGCGSQQQQMTAGGSGVMPVMPPPMMIAPPTPHARGAPMMGAPMMGAPMMVHHHHHRRPQSAHSAHSPWASQPRLGRVPVEPAVPTPVRSAFDQRHILYYTRAGSW